MPPFVQFLIRRLGAALISGVVITMVLYASIMLVPAEQRAQLYVPKTGNAPISENYIPVIIRKHHLDDPFLIQYWYWVRSLADGTWGYSPVLDDHVLPSLLRRTPQTLELAFYSLLLIIPAGLASGLIAGWQPGKRFDSWFRATAYVGTNMPPFIFAFIALGVFYVKLHWFAPGRMDPSIQYHLQEMGYISYTGLLTLDGLLNRRPDITLMAFRHLAMPIMTLAMFHWATLGRITRATVLDERRKEYITAARARGVREHNLLWQHALRPILAPSLTTMVLSAASIVTGIFVVEIIFGMPGVSQIIVIAMQGVAADAPSTLGFAVYSVLMVIGLMFIMDVLQAMLDPRVRDEVLKS